jgi:hypothetical protein
MMTRYTKIVAPIVGGGLLSTIGDTLKKMLYNPDTNEIDDDDDFNEIIEKLINEEDINEQTKILNDIKNNYTIINSIGLEYINDIRSKNEMLNEYNMEYIAILDKLKYDTYNEIDFKSNSDKLVELSNKYKKSNQLGSDGISTILKSISYHKNKNIGMNELNKFYLDEYNEYRIKSNIANKHIEELLLSLQQYEKTNDNLTESLNTINHDNESKISSKNIEINKLKDEVKTLKNEFDKYINYGDELTEQIKINEQLISTNTSIKTAMDEITRKLMKLQETNTDTNDEVENQTERNTQLERENNELHTLIGQLSTQISDNITKIQHLELTNNPLKTTNTSITLENTKLQSKNTSLEKIVMDLNKQSVSLTESLDKSNQSKRNLIDILKTITNIKFENDINPSIDLIDGIKINPDLKIKLINYIKKIKEIYDKNKELEADIDKLTKQNSILTVDNKTYKDNSLTQRISIGYLQIEKSNLQSILNNLQQQLTIATNRPAVAKPVHYCENVMPPVTPAECYTHAVFTQ